MAKLTKEEKELRDLLINKALLTIAAPAALAALVVAYSFKANSPTEWILGLFPFFIPWSILTLLFKFSPILAEPWSQAPNRVWFWPLLYAIILYSWSLAWSATPFALLTPQGVTRIDLMWGNPLLIGGVAILQILFLAFEVRVSGRQKA